MRTNDKPRTTDLVAVALAAMVWHRARADRLAVAKLVRAEQLHHPLSHLAQARGTEARALAALRKACAKAEADPTNVNASYPAVIDVQAKEIPKC